MLGFDDLLSRDRGAAKEYLSDSYVDDPAVFIDDMDRYCKGDMDDLIYGILAELWSHQHRDETHEQFYARQITNIHERVDRFVDYIIDKKMS